MNEKVYMHAIRCHDNSFNEQVSVFEKILSSGELLSHRLLKDNISYGYNGYDYISLCDYERKNYYPSDRMNYNSFNAYVRYGLSLAFDKEKVEAIKPKIILDTKYNKKITDDCNSINTRGGSLVYTTSNSENYLLYNSIFKKINSSNVWLYKDGYIYANEKGITYYDGAEEKTIFTDTKEYSIKYVDGHNNTMLIVDSEGYGEGSNYKKIDLTNYNVDNADFTVKSFIRTIEYK